MVVIFVAVCDRQVEVAKRVGLYARQDTIEGEEGGPQAGPRDSHGIKGVDVEDVETAAPCPSEPWSTACC